MRTTARVILAVIFFIAPAAVSAFAEETRILTGREYFHAADRLMQEAKTSITAAMYLINVDPTPNNNPASILLEDLISAKKRGVRVKVVLDKSMFRANYNAYKRLKNAGADAAFNSTRTTLHGKALAIDGKICLVGSNNWSEASLADNYELAMVTQDRQGAAKIVDYIGKIALDQGPPIEPAEQAGVELPASLLTNIQAPEMSKLMTERSEKAFDLYLYFVKKAWETKSNRIKINYKEVSWLTLGRLLNRRYGLIRHKAWSKYVELADAPGEESITIPYEYWENGYDKKLPLRGKYLYLVALRETGRSERDPYWFRSAADMSAEYHLAPDTIEAGLAELARENIVEIYRDRPEEGKPFSDRLANRYRLNPLRSQAEFEAAVAELAQKYSAGEAAAARELTAELDEPKDIEKIERYIGLVREYGLEKVKKVNAEVAAKHLQTGFRDIEQVVEKLKNG